ncbi:MAG: phosphonate ABC transporter ATP-binding protein [bacterium]
MTQDAVRLDRVTFAYDGRQTVLHDVSLVVPAGCRLVLMGPSGSGKTTLLRVIRGLVRPQEGAVRVFGRDPAAGQMADVGYIPQQLGLLRSRTAVQNVLIGGLCRAPVWQSLAGTSAPAEIDEAVRLLHVVGLGHKVHEQAFRLSGGERQRVAIARTLMQQPRLILADEFVSDLDQKTAKEILNLMTTLASAVTLVMATHSTWVADEFADVVAVLHDGTLTSAAASRPVLT